MRASFGRIRTAALAGRTPATITPLLVDPVVGRSGSTVMMKILASSPAVAVDRVYPYENRYLPYLCRLVEHVDGDSGGPPDWTVTGMLSGDRYRIGPIPFAPLSLDSSELAVRLTRHVWAAFVESATSAAEVPPMYYAEKTVGRTVEILARAEIPLKLINLVRDPRDVVCSIRNFDEKRGYYGFGRREGQSDDEYLAELVNMMKRSLDRMHQRAERHTHMWVRYEDIIQSPDEVGLRLSEWLGVELDVASATVADDEYRAHATAADPDDSVGRWRRELPPTDVAYMTEHLGAEMSRLGYEPGDG